jgi:hypothetical protein
LAAALLTANGSDDAVATPFMMNGYTALTHIHPVANIRGDRRRRAGIMFRLSDGSDLVGEPELPTALGIHLVQPGI